MIRLIANKKLVFIFLLCTISTCTIAQNLIRNGHLSDTVQFQPSQLLYARYWLNQAISNSVDYLNDDQPIINRRTRGYSGTQDPKFGVGYFGLIMYNQVSHGSNNREYVKGELKKVLDRDSTYCFRVWISLADSMNYALKNQIGVYFSQTVVDSPQINHQILHLQPQINFQDSSFLTDTSSWTMFDGSFTALGGERFFVIGNFNPDSTLDTLRLSGRGTHPNYLKSYYYLDGFWLSSCDSLPTDTLTSLAEESIKKDEILLYPNPTSGIFHFQFVAQQNQNTYLQFFDINGKLVYSRNISRSEQMDLSFLNKGMYFYKISRGNKVLKNGKLVIAN